MTCRYEYKQMYKCKIKGKFQSIFLTSGKVKARWDNGEVCSNWILWQQLKKHFSLLKIKKLIYIQYNTIKPKTFKPNLLDEPKYVRSGIFLFFIFAFYKPKLSLNRSKTDGLLQFGLTMLYCIYI